MNNVYIVKSGDNMSLIAKKNNIILTELLKLNPNVKPPEYVIHPNQEIKLPTSIQQRIINVLKTIKETTPDTEPEDTGTECPTIKEEIILIVGTEQHSATYGNKMMFPAQAIREVKENYVSSKYVTILMFTDGFNSEELKQVEESAKMHNANINFIKINTITELIGHINVGTNKITRLNPNSENHLVKIKTIKIFAHGLPSIFDFGLDGSHQESQRFKIAHVSQLKVTSFMSKPKIYSYACRTGNTSWNETFGSDWESEVKPKKSLAQELANHLDAEVYAFLRRSLYISTWNDGGDEDFQKNYEQIEDESINGALWRFQKWDEALWNDSGAYAPPTVGSTPIGDIPKTMYIFEKNKEPRSQ